MNPNISVIMSVYNEKISYLKESIDSILNQTYKNFEFIIIDDCSTNKECIELLLSYEKQDRRIKLIHNKKNLGLTKSLNIALKNSRGIYIARMDSDDISIPTRFSEQYCFMEKHLQYYLCGSQVQFINNRSQKISFKSLPKFSNNLLIYFFHPFWNQFIHSSFFFKREIIEKYNIRYDEKYKYAQDYDFIMNVLSKNLKITNINKKLLLYRVNQNSISFKNFKDQENLAQKIRKKYLKKLKHNILGFSMNVILHEIKKMRYQKNENK